MECLLVWRILETRDWLQALNRAAVLILVLFSENRNMFPFRVCKISIPNTGIHVYQTIPGHMFTSKQITGISRVQYASWFKQLSSLINWLWLFFSNHISPSNGEDESKLNNFINYDTRQTDAFTLIFLNRYWHIVGANSRLLSKVKWAMWKWDISSAGTFPHGLKTAEFYGLWNSFLYYCLPFTWL